MHIGCQTAVNFGAFLIKKSVRRHDLIWMNIDHQEAVNFVRWACSHNISDGDDA